MELTTRRAGLSLRSLADVDADAYTDLTRDNARHLTRFGDHRELVSRSAIGLAEDIAGADPTLAFAVHKNGSLVGSAALVAVDPPRFGLGYLLARSACGRGIATLVVAALLDHAALHLGGTDVFAGVTHGNRRSSAVLERNGFRRIEAFETYDRYHLRMAPAPALKGDG